MTIGAVSSSQKVVDRFSSLCLSHPLGWIGKRICLAETKEQELLVYRHAFIIAAGAGSVAAVAALIAGLPAIAALIGTITLCSGAGARAAHLGSFPSTCAARNPPRKSYKKHLRRIQFLQNEIAREKEHVISLQAETETLKSNLSQESKNLKDLTERHRSLQAELEKAATEPQPDKKELSLRERVSNPHLNQIEVDYETYAEVMEDDYQDIVQKLDQLTQQEQQFFSISHILSIKGRKKQKEHFIAQVNALKGVFDSSLHQLKAAAQRINQHTIVSAELKILKEVRKAIAIEKRDLARLQAKKERLQGEVSVAIFQLQEARRWLQGNIEVIKKDLEVCVH